MSHVSHVVVEIWLPQENHMISFARFISRKNCYIFLILLSIYIYKQGSQRAPMPIVKIWAVYWGSGIIFSVHFFLKFWMDDLFLNV